MKIELDLLKKSCVEKDDKISVLDWKCVVLELEIEKLKKEFFVVKEE